MRSLVYLAAAERDLVSILEYITRESGSVAIGRGFTDQVQAHCAKLASLPGTLGRARPELRPDIRSSIYKNYIVFFRYRDDAATRFIEFFTANIRNANTRRAYGRAVGDFFGWMERSDIGALHLMQPVHVAAWVENLGRRHAAPTVKQHLAAVRMLFDWLVTGQAVRHNPATAVRGPKHVVRKGKTPVLGPQETRMLLDRIPDDMMAGRRDRALIGLMVYTFARVGAALDMRVEDVFHQHRRLWVRLHEKGGKHHEIPCHHNLEHYLQDYIHAAGIAEDRKGPLFRTIERGTDRLSSRPLPPQNAWDMVRRRARQAGIQTRINNHTFRATGITTYLTNGGQLEKAAHMAAHSSTRTTQLYDRRSDDVSLDEVERIVI